MLSNYFCQLTREQTNHSFAAYSLSLVFKGANSSEWMKLPATLVAKMRAHLSVDVAPKKTFVAKKS